MRHVASTVAHAMRALGYLMLVPALVALAYEPYDVRVAGMALPRNALVFVAGSLMAFLVSLPARFVPADPSEMADRDMYLSLALGWLLATGLSTTPFLLSGILDRPWDAWFEAMSGLTGTAATSLPAPLLEVPESLLFWRAMLQIAGGITIVALSVTLLLRLAYAGQVVYAAEPTGPGSARSHPSVPQTMRRLAPVYVVSLSVLFFLVVGTKMYRGATWGDAFLEASIHAMSTVSAGGFTPYIPTDSWLLQVAFIVFMVAAGTNVVLQKDLLGGEWRRLVRDAEWRFYLLGLFGSAALITGLLWRAGGALLGSVADAVFTAVSFGSGTGFTGTDYTAWPMGAQLLLVVLILVGGTAGSVAGGLRVLRVVLLIKIVRREVRKLLHPRAVIPVRIGPTVVRDEALFTVAAFFFTFITIWILGAMYLILVEPALDVFDGTVLAASAISNVGPGTGAFGPEATHASLLPGSKIVASLLMWVGRLEVIAALMLFNPASWRS